MQSKFIISLIFLELCRFSVQLQLDCYYMRTFASSTEWTCRLERPDLIDIPEDDEITFNGNQSMKNSVTSVWFVSPAMEFIPGQIFTEFKNLKSLRIFRSNFPILDRNTFRDPQFQQLRTFECDYCLIREIKEGTFDSLENLEEVYLHFNDIISLNTNIFSNNKRLRKINFDNNHINAIEPTFFDNLKNLESASFEANECTSKYYNSTTLFSIKNDMRKCFRNWNVAQHDAPSVAMENYFRKQEMVLQDSLLKFFFVTIGMVVFVLSSMLLLVYVSYKNILKTRFFKNTDEMHVSFVNNCAE